MDQRHFQLATTQRAMHNKSKQYHLITVTKNKISLFLPERWNIQSAHHLQKSMVSCQPSPFHDTLNFDFFKSTRNLNTLQMQMDLVFILKWVKSVISCALYIFYLSGCYTILAYFPFMQQCPQWSGKLKGALARSFTY